MKRYFTVFLVFIMVLSLTACGKSHNTQASGSENYHGEGQVQGGIKSDEEIAALQEEERAGTTDAQTDTETTTEQPTESDDTPATSGTDSYWQGDSYFDLVGYLEDNGYKFVKPYDINGNCVKDGQNIDRYLGQTEDNMWLLTIFHGYISVVYIGGDPTAPVNSPSYIGYADYNNQRDIVIDSYGTTISSNTLESLFIIVDNIHEDESDMNPLRNTNMQIDSY